MSHTGCSHFLGDATPQEGSTQSSKEERAQVFLAALTALDPLAARWPSRDAMGVDASGNSYEFSVVLTLFSQIGFQWVTTR